MRRGWMGPMRRIGIVGSAILILTACRGVPFEGFPQPGASSPRWPSAPEPARVAYVMDIRAHEDLFRPGGFWNALGELIGGKEDSALSRPYAVAPHPGGGLLVTDPGRGMVHWYDWGRQRYLALGAREPLPSPVAVAALADGRVLVSDSRLGTVEAFDAEGRRLAPFVAQGLVARPTGLAADEAHGRVYVADTAGHRIGVFDLSGRLVQWIGRRGEGDGEFNFPTSLAMGPQGLLVVADSMNFRVQVLDPRGTFIRSIGRHGSAPGMLARPKGVAVDSQGNVIVAEGLFDTLEFFGPSGEFLLHLGQPGQGPGEFWLAAGLALDRATGHLFVADSYNSRVQVFQLEPSAPRENREENR